MAFGNGFFSGISGAVSDILGGEAQSAGLNIKAGALDIEAMGTRLNATGMRLRSTGDMTSAENYDLASTLAKQNAEYTSQSTAIQLQQEQRQIYLGLGETQSG